MSVRRSMLASVAGEKPGRPQFVGIAEILPSEGRGQDSAFQFAPPPVECHRIPRAPHHFRRPRPEPPSALFLDGLSSCPSSKNKRFGARSDKRKCTQSLHVSSKLLCRG
jgi:hypothetical protein